MARRRRTASRAYDKVHGRYWRSYRTQVTKKKPSALDDWKFIWSDRTRRGKRRSWIQRLFRW